MLIRIMTLACVAHLASATETAHNNYLKPPDQAYELATTASFLMSALSSDDPPTLDLGEVVRSTVTPLRFEIVNDRETSQAMTSVRSACACVTVSAWPKMLEAGETGLASGEFHAPKRSGAQRTSDVNILLDNELLGTLVVTAMIVDPIKSDIALVEDEFVVTLRARDGKGFRVLGAVPDVRFRASEPGASLPEQTVAFAATDWRRAGEPRRVALRIDHPDQRHVIHTFVYVVKDDIVSVSRSFISCASGV